MEQIINRIKDYFVGLEIANSEIKVKIKYPKDDWNILTDKENVVKISKLDNNILVYKVSQKYKTLEELINFIEYTIEFNQELELKKEILVQKYQELATIVSEHTAEELQNLTWILKTTKKKTKKQTNKKIEEKQNDNVVEENVENNDTSDTHLQNETILTSTDVDNLKL